MSNEKIFHNLTPLELALINLVAYREGLSLYKANKDHLGYFTTEEEINTLSTLDELENLARVPNYMKGINAIGHLVDHLILEATDDPASRLRLCEFARAFNQACNRLYEISIEGMRAKIPGTSLEIAHCQLIEQTHRIVPLYEREIHNLTILEGEEYKGKNQKPLPKNVTDLSQFVVIYYTDCFGGANETYLNLSQLEQTIENLKKLEDDRGFDRWEANLIIS